MKHKMSTENKPTSSISVRRAGNAGNPANVERVSESEREKNRKEDDCETSGSTST